MSLPHFYLSSQVLDFEKSQEFVLLLDADDIKHARVLRLVSGEHIAVIDAARDYFECEIISFQGEIMSVCIACREDQSLNYPKVVLVQGLAKGDKMEMVVRHATELGVSAFVPLACDRSIVKLDEKKSSAKTKRWQTIAKSAAMQSGQRAIPEVHETSNMSRLQLLLSQVDVVLVCWEEASQTAHLYDALTKGVVGCGLRPCDASVAVVVGPEGGLTQREIDILLASNPQTYLITLGPSILRTETAGLVAPALVLYELSRIQNFKTT